jgi:hypothetical protein
MDNQHYKKKYLKYKSKYISLVKNEQYSANGGYYGSSYGVSNRFDSSSQIPHFGTKIEPLSKSMGMSKDELVKLFKSLSLVYDPVNDVLVY